MKSKMNNCMATALAVGLLASMHLTSALADAGYGVPVPSPSSDAGSCDKMMDKFTKVFGSLAIADCANINTDTTLNDNPYVYTSKDITDCIDSLQMPGLPGFGVDLGGSVCDGIRNITGGMVDAVNQKSQQAADDVVSAVNKKSAESVGFDVWDENINPKDIIMDKYGNSIDAAADKAASVVTGSGN